MKRVQAMWSAVIVLLASILCLGELRRGGSSMVEWPYVGGDPGVTRYSPLEDINTSNVTKLALAWEWKSPDQLMPQYKVTPGAFTSTPLMIDNVVYVSTNLNRVAALDADTGKEKWVYDPHSYEAGMPALAGGFRHRGVAAWRDKDKLRIVLATRYKLICIDAETGKPVPTFGDHGVVDTSVALGRDVDKNFLEYNDAPVVYKDLFIVGTATGDSVFGKDPPGSVRAFDAHTGKLVWTFHMIPQPGEFGNDTWLDNSWKINGSTDVWAGISVDEKRGLIYVPGGNPTNSYYGGLRPGNTLFAQTLVCLDAKTGKRIWHFQTVHHDLWDYDLPTQPMLFTINHDGRKVDVVAQISKQGLVFVFDRVTGKPIWPIVETPVPQSDIPGERTSPTQPIPTKPPIIGVSGGVTLDDANDLTPEIKTAAQEELKKFHLGPLYTPPSLEGSFAWPGGGINWGGGAYDRELDRLYLKTSNMPSPIRVAKFDPETSRNPFKSINRDPGYESVSAGRASVKGLPLTKPPYGKLSSVDMSKGDILWAVPMGRGNEAIRTNPALAGVQLPDRLGATGPAGSIVTKGGLVFVGGGDKGFYAFNKESGREVWSMPLPRVTTGTPMTYRSRSGRQFVLVATGSGDDAVLVAFALSEK